MTTYLTVAIPYVNASPHVGYAYELVEADVFARARRLAGEDVRFVGGTDDFSLKNVLGAEAAGVPTREFVDAHATEFEELAGPLDLSFDDFLRTSADARHAPAVSRLWRACAASGDLYKRDYEGDYCVGCEQFYEPAEAPDRYCPDHGTPLEPVAEANWFFRLSAYQDHLDDLISSGALAVHPPPFRNEVLSFVRRGLQDLSVSRSVSRARGWGLPVPGDPSQVIYVWFDALAYYLSALRFGAPDSAEYRRWWLESDERVHVVGKGILRFHAVYWPAFLASAGQPPPTRIQVHPYLSVEGAKISKSSGVTVDPRRLVEDVGTDALRWWFARDVVQVSDTDFTFERLVARANHDLANGLGNVTKRIVTLVHRLRDGSVPAVDVDAIATVGDVERDVADRLGHFDLIGAARAITAAITALNRDLEATKPWTLGHDALALDALLARYVACVQQIARAARPIVPALADRLLAQVPDDRPLPEPEAAFVRLRQSRSPATQAVIGRSLAGARSLASSPGCQSAGPEALQQATQRLAHGGPRPALVRRPGDQHAALHQGAEQELGEDVEVGGVDRTLPLGGAESGQDRRVGVLGVDLVVAVDAQHRRGVDECDALDVGLE
jgi:methionyl-tRNA synthetase